jgi:bifunctional N-acetylglucosamine-1-phosphate-uridyltransferase/glucosamine-1-phosphate-acetyltransferase GlmU-like protein
MAGDTLTVILPCAGEGTRLGLPYPKELHVIQKGTSLMDMSLRHVDLFAERVDKVVITLTPSKHALIKAQEKWLDVIDFAFTFFKPWHHEWPGSILSAKRLFGDYNMVLLPDACLIAHKDHALVPTMLELLKTHSVVFGYLPESDPKRLKALGALHVTENGRVTKFADKPAENFERYNAFWFRREVGEDLLELMTHSVRRVPVLIESLGAVGAFPVESYLDLGTWENQAQFHAKV